MSCAFKICFNWLGRVCRKKNLPTLLIGMQIGIATMENGMELPYKTKTQLPYDPAIPLIGIYQEKTIIRKDTCTPVFMAALFTRARTWKQPQCPSTGEWIKMWYIFTMEYYSAKKRTK